MSIMPGASFRGIKSLIKAFFALMLVVGTFATALTVVTVSPAAAANLPVVTSVSPASGLPAGGTTVTILGTTLQNATAVDFGGVAASITSNAAGKIVVKSPAGTDNTTVNVTVTSANGTSAVGPNTVFSYADVPTVTSIAGDNGPTSGGNSIVINGTGFIAPSVKFATAAATSITVLSSTQIEAVVPAEPVPTQVPPPTSTTSPSRLGVVPRPPVPVAPFTGSALARALDRWHHNQYSSRVNRLL